MRAIPASSPATDDLSAPWLVLRDGTVTSVRAAGAADRDELRRFLRGLSVESRWNRFLSLAEPSAALIDQSTASTEDGRALTLVAYRNRKDGAAIVAVASYIGLTEVAAEVAFAVDDRFQGRGLGTLLLERLAAHAAVHGFRRFHATTSIDNVAMLDVFRDSGFEVRSRSAAGTVDVQLSLAASAEGVASAERRRRLATAESLRPMLEPRAVALIGASRDPSKMGGRILHALNTSGYLGPVYAVHPHATTISGTRTVRSARELPAGVDLAIVAVPPNAVLAAVDDCAAAGVRSLVVVTAGFAETGSEGRARQDALLDKVRGYGMRMIGPNCLGLLNMSPDVRLNASFSPIVPTGGSVAFSSQSGALGIAILGLASDRHLGLSTFVSVGNKADVSSNDLLEYWEEDARTRVILLYLESFGNPRRFARIARRVARRKPIVALKAGRSSAGSRAAGSHTAALAAKDSAVDALFQQTGVIRAETIDEMFDVAALLEAQPLPAGRRLAVLTNAGGPGILAIDACDRAGLVAADLSAETRTQLQSFLPPTASLNNPVDMVASAGAAEYGAAVETMVAAQDNDAVLVIFTPVDRQSSEGIVGAIQDGVTRARAAGATGKPVLACVLAESDGAVLRAGPERLPTYMFPENAVRALGKVAAYAAWRARPGGLFWGFDDINLHKARAICRAALASRGDSWLTDQEVWDVLHAFALPAAVRSLAHTADEAVASASVIGLPVAAKLASAKVLHKTELGVVLLNLATPQAVRDAFTEISARAARAVGAEAIDGIVIQPMVGGGVETIVGITHDPVFGPLVGFGLGGVNVEVFGDVRFRIAPLTDEDADDVLHEIRGLPLLMGYRGRAPADMDALRDLLLRVSRLADAVPEIVELDLNPVIALAPGQGCRIVDARMRVAARPRAGMPVASSRPPLSSTSSTS
jgi:acetyl coenzyme A synthetase (ADP forming)-like protein